MQVASFQHLPQSGGGGGGGGGGQAMDGGTAFGIFLGVVLGLAALGGVYVFFIRKKPAAAAAEGAVAPGAGNAGAAGGASATAGATATPSSSAQPSTIKHDRVQLAANVSNDFDEAAWTAVASPPVTTVSAAVVGLGGAHVTPGTPATPPPHS